MINRGNSIIQSFVLKFGAYKFDWVRIIADGLCVPLRARLLRVIRILPEIVAIISFLKLGQKGDNHNSNSTPCYFYTLRCSTLFMDLLYIL